MPIVQIELLEGRSTDQKRAMARKVTDVIATEMNCPAEAVRIIIREMKTENYAEAGTLRVDK